MSHPYYSHGRDNIKVETVPRGTQVETMNQLQYDLEVVEEIYNFVKSKRLDTSISTELTDDLESVMTSIRICLKSWKLRNKD